MDEQVVGVPTDDERQAMFDAEQRQASDEHNEDAGDELTERERKEIARRKKANQQAAALRLELEQLKAEKAERERQEMSELDRLRADLDTARAEAEAAKHAAMWARVESMAARMGFADPEDARLVDPALLGAGEPKDIEIALKDLLDRKPHLKGQHAPPDTPRGGNPPGSASGRAAEARESELRRRFSIGE